jgi:hypothetical protein
MVVLIISLQFLSKRLFYVELTGMWACSGVVIYAFSEGARQRAIFSVSD